MSHGLNWRAAGTEYSPSREFQSANAYLRWRGARMRAEGLAEGADAVPSEMLLQQAWLHQRVVRDRLRTADGKPVKVLHPGFWNREPGPDFQKAVIQIGAGPPVSGDVEIDLEPSGWRQHGHDTNPAYRGVVLHVTWEPARTEGEIPALSLKQALDAPPADLAFWLGLEPGPRPASLDGQCSGPFRALEANVTRDVIRQAAQARLRAKAEQLLARARQVGWNGALWEGLFSALGYKRNVWPMRRLAELLPMLTGDLPRATDPSEFLQSRFLGASGMLPADLRQARSSERYLRTIWDAWWRDADAMREHALPPKLWSFAGIRPVNHPQRRLALAAHWVGRGHLPRQLEQWIERTLAPEDLLPSLEELLQVKHDPFWSFRCTLRSAPASRPSPLLGSSRVTDLAINIVLPWLFIRACAGRNDALTKVVETRYLLWPAGEDNSVLKLARQRLFGGVASRFLKTAAEQQGVIQIVRDFCDHSNAACEHCQFPDLLRTLSAVKMNPGSAPDVVN